MKHIVQLITITLLISGGIPMDYTPSGEPIFGGSGASAEIRSEFGNIAAAVNSKVDKTGGVVTGPITATEITASVKVTTPSLVLGATPVTASADEINKLDGLTASTDELNYVDGVESGIQGQINNRIISVATSGVYESRVINNGVSVYLYSLKNAVQTGLVSLLEGNTEIAGAESISLTAPVITLSGIPVYADNTAAITGGLGAGNVYRTSTGILMIVY